jgi:hypothetical protein
MKKNIRVKIKKNMGGVLLNKIQILNLSNQNLVDDLINELKSLTSEIKYLNVEKEELYFGTQLMKLGETVPDENGISLMITIS